MPSCDGFSPDWHQAPRAASIDGSLVILDTKLGLESDIRCVLNSRVAGNRAHRDSLT